jgi:hypothetical protein
MMARGEIVDGKTIMLLQYAKLHLFSDRSRNYFLGFHPCRSPPNVC